MKSRHLLSCLLLTSLIGCGGVGEYRRTGHAYAPRGPSCDYRVIRDRAIEPYEELGVIDVDAFSPRQLPDDEEHFRKVVGPAVCAAGGHAIIPTLDIQGRWVHGAIIRFNPSECAACEPKTMQDGEG